MKDAVKSEWEVRPLGEVVTLNYGKALARSERDPNGSVPVYGANGVMGWSEHTLAEGPSLVVGRKGSAGEVTRVDGPFWPSDVTYYTMHDQDALDFDFLHYTLQTLNLPSMARGVKPGINRNDVYALPIPLPPLEEQQRIVAVLDAAFEGLARARAHAEANLQNARELFENFLAGKMASESNDWATYSFGDSNVLKIVDGDRGANYPKMTDFLSEGHCLFLNTKNVRPDGFNFDETMFISEERDQLLRKGKLLPRDVLLTTRGTIGNVAIFDDTVPYEHIRINSGMLILRPNEDIIRAEFLFELLRSAVIKEQIEEHVSGAAQPQLPIRSLVKFKLPAPQSTKEQLQIVEQLKQLSDKVSDMLEGYEKKVQDLDDLRQSLLQKAFAGKLT